MCWLYGVKHVAIGSGLLLFLGLCSPRAEACEVEELHSQLAVPANHALDVALDSTVVVSFDFPGGWFDCNPSTVSGWEVSVTRSSDGQAITGSLEPWNLHAYCASSGGALAWKPAAPFDPGATYEVNVTWTGFELEELSYQTQFTTGSALLPAITLEGAPNAATKVTKDHIATLCMQPDQCGNGGGCQYVDFHRVHAVIGGGLRATGGQEASGYDVALTWSTEAGGAQSKASFRDAHFAANEPMTFDMVLPDIGQSYSPCFYVTARDAAGNVSAPASTCIGPIDPGEMIPDEPVDPDAGADGGAGTGGVWISGTTTGSRDSDGGCSTRGGSGSSVLTSLFAFGLVALGRRRQSIARTANTGR